MSEIETQALQIIETAIEIRDTVSYKQAAHVLKAAKAHIKVIREHYKPLKESAFAAHKAVTKSEKDMLLPVEDLCRDTSGKMVGYQREQDWIAREEQARLEAIQREREEETRLAEAEAAEQAGDAELAEQIIDEPVELPPVVVQSSTPKIAGISHKKTWKAEVTSKVALIKFVAENQKWLHLLDVNTKEIGRLATAQKSALSIPGIKAVEHTSFAVR